MIQEGIIITFPVQFLLDLSRLPHVPRNFAGTEKKSILSGFKECMRQLEAVRTNPDDNIWNHSIGSKPTREVLYAYITILGKIIKDGGIEKLRKELVNLQSSAQDILENITKGIKAIEDGK